MLRRLCFFALCALSASSSFASDPLQDIFYTGRAIPFYGSARTPRQQAILDKFKGEHLSESLAQTVHGTVRLKRNLSLGFDSCGIPNASYNPEKSSITFCLEMIELIAKQIEADPKLNRPENVRAQQQVVVGVVYGIFMHELGHAVIDINKVPITGREEDVADQFSLFYATKIIEPLHIPVVFPTVWFWRSMEARHDMSSAEVVRQVMSNEHSLDAQRVYNLACWALGANPKGGMRVATFAQLPNERASRCAAEYGRLDFAMRSLFGKYLVIKRT